MGTNNSGKKSRNVFKTAHKYQDRIIFLTIYPSLFIFLSFSGIIFMGNLIISRAVVHTSFLGMIKLINQFSEWMGFLICLIFLISVIGAFVISHHIVGAFGRIIHELDEIIAGRSKKSIIVRPKDDLSNELLKRINILVEYYVKNKNEK